MQIYPETKAPGETKDYTFDWSPKLASGESVASITVAFVESGGSTQPYPATEADNISRVWLSGGTPGKRVIFTVRAVTNSTPPRTLEEAFGVDVVDPAVAPTDADEIAAELKVLRAARVKLASGERVKEVMRGGRKLIYGEVTLDALNALIETRERDLASAQAAASGQPRRRAIGLGWAN